MPIILDESLNKESTNRLMSTVSPSYFSKALTGSGKNTGLLNSTLLPERKASNSQPLITCREIHTTISTGTADYELIPTDFLDISGADINELPAIAVCISPDNVTDEYQQIHIGVLMKNMVLITEDKQAAPVNASGKATRKRTLQCTYQILIFRKRKDNNGKEYYNAQVYNEPCLNTDQFVNTYSFIDRQILEDYFSSLTVYDIVCQTAEVWANHIPTVIQSLVNNNIIEQDLRFVCGKLNNYSVNLEDYQKIYDILAQNRPDKINSIIEVNLNLLLNDALKRLKQNKSNIQTFTPVPLQPNSLKLSPEQVKAVTTTEPCCIVQAGAGTGKSTVIHNRLNYLKTCGVDLHNVMVLSFTNAAADHIRTLAPEVNSKTIASMIHDIYSNNYSHNLSTIDTMLNILYAKKDINKNPDLAHTVNKLINALKILKKSINEGLVSLSELVKNDFDNVITVLDMINQTTLELESIICYYADANLTEPNPKCTHLIMDEVQDNSIFEFIYIIRYIIRHQASIYLVGDCSQTLYEFRASNPKALNCLEMSGVFECMQLQTNYRSNQNILDFANVTLATIEANQFAKIQLHANSFDTRPFEDDVIVQYHQLSNRTTGLYDHIPVMFYGIKEWIQDKIDKGEQVCFLSYKRKDLASFERSMESLFPQQSLINITPKKSFAQSFFSKYINYLGDDYSHKIGNDPCVEIMRHMVDNIERLVFDNQKDILKQCISEWTMRYRQDLIVKDLQLQNNIITADEFKNAVFETLIEYEIDKNAMKQRIISLANEKLKASDISSYDFVCSTIHSAKGLEFDNVILLYDENSKNDEEMKRMYYVGLTRAKNAECILAYGINKSSAMANTYELMVETAKKKRQTAAMPDDTAVTTQAAESNTGSTETANFQEPFHGKNPGLKRLPKYPRSLKPKKQMKCQTKMVIRPQCHVLKKPGTKPYAMKNRK